VQYRGKHKLRMQTMAPAKNARVCIISFSAFKPTFVTNSPDLFKKK